MRNDPRSHGLWERSAPPAPPTSPLSADMTADVVVVGAGFTGLSAALHLAEAGASVVVLEGVEIGFGGSGRNVGLVNAGMWVMPDDLPGELGEVYGNRLLHLLGDAPRLVFELVEKHAIACEIERTGTLHCAVGVKGFAELQERARQWQARGAPVHLLDAEETARKVGTTAYTGSLLDLRAGTIQPLAYARGLAAAAIKAGARIFTSSPVVDAQEADSGWLVRTGGGSVRARWVIVATNAYTTSVWPQIRAELVHLPYFNLATRPLGDNLHNTILPERQGVWDTKEILSSFRFDQQGRLVFGSVGALRGPGRSIHPNWGRRALRKLFPQLADVEFEYEWYGSIGMTTNNLPRFHRLARNVVSFSGYNGRGIAPGTTFGRTLARLVLGEIAEADLPLPLTDPEPVRYRAVKETYYEVGAQIAHAATDRL
ncbi:FAD-dependent oxidoreductase [Microvirga sp. KLBC 81]|uniref:NAD(P)/FAD-dependent oxidoreductase n=1 Tax=Microvirga sp. KLBC 81 TaxID=1862707 RepID=UPI000D52255E|nr:FAD-binding oxidoreductase [Microvirga sp. KLBC 81]PVE24925.1 FAD-dependent oxidoreductase [Microvirga sp. KLBC 81]